ncbi:MAG TPA: ATP-binding protein [Polyangiaceae bacterium]|nr:ATP-binding protein [Polyangiaceae bacterium]
MEPRSEVASATSFLDGGGELGALMRAYDFSATPLGPPGSWPRSLKTAVRIMLTSRQPFWLGWGPELTYLYNDPYRSIIGGKHPQALGRPFREVWHEIWDVVGPMAERVMTRDEGTYVEAQLLIMQRHGYQEETYYTFSYSPIPGDEGGTAGLICANTDDTQRVVGARQMRTLQELSARGAKARTRREACEWSVEALGSNPQDLPFVLVYLTDATADAPVLAASSPGTGALEPIAAWPWQRALETQGPELFELSGLAGPLPAGAWRREPSHAVVLPLSSAGPGGRAGVLVAGLSPYRRFDDTYRGFLELVAHQVAGNVANAEAYEQERQRADALLALDRAKTEFFSNVSHEFRTPLTLMLGPLEDTLTQSDALPAADRARLELAHKNSLRLQKLVNTLLDFSRIESGRTEVCYEPTDLGTFTAELASVFRSAVERAELALTVDCPPLGAGAYVDREMWEKIVFNLLSNALKFTFEGEIRVVVRQGDGGVRLSVADTGTGIPAADLPHVFERFHRVQGARGRSIEGSGIGLALVRELVKLHGGNVSVESTVDRGSTFQVWLPLGDAHLAPTRIRAARSLATTALSRSRYVQAALGWLPSEGLAEQPARDREQSGAKPAARLLLCDDNADLRAYLERLLEDGYEVEAVSDGDAALAAARRQPPDLVVTDVMMPGLDGFGLLRELRADERLQRVPVIMLSARAGESARIEGIRSGADDYLVKPFSARELLARIETRLEVSRLERDLERQRRELARSEARYRGIFETAPVSILEQDHSGVRAALEELAAAGVRDLPRYLAEHRDFVRHALSLVRTVDANAAALRLFGAPDKAQLLGSVGAAFAPSSEAFLAQALLAIAGDTVFEAEARVRTLDGRELDTLVSVAFPRDGSSGVLVSLMDNTAQKAAERALREEARTLETLNHVGRLLTAELDFERIMQSVIDAATEVAGATFGLFLHDVTEERGHTSTLCTLCGAPREAFEELGTPRDIASLLATLRSEDAVRVADVTADPRFASFPRPKGHPPVRSYLGVPVVSRTGEVVGGLFFGHPQPNAFSERAKNLIVSIASHASVALDSARLYEQRAALVSQLRESDRRKDEFLATLAHELRNPLAPLRNALHGLRLLGDGEPLSGSVREMMERQVGHLVRLVDDLLEISRISRGTFELRRERTELAAVVRNAVEMSDPFLRAAGHELSVTLTEEPLFLDGDPTRLTQILANLLNNAAKYTESRGHIGLSVSQLDGDAVISVRDDGIGIEREALPRIFEMFNRGGGAKRGQSGLGIGLALARRLAEMHGGGIEAQSDGPGRGSQFSVRLPLAPAELTAASEERQESAFDARKRVLVVDDNIDAAEALGMLLEIFGAEVKLAHDGATALEQYARYDPDLVLLDIGMPDMDGHEVARRIRAEHAARRTTIIALTGWGQAEDRRRSHEAGFDGHLVKPAPIDAVKDVLTRVPSRLRTKPDQS